MFFRIKFWFQEHKREIVLFALLFLISSISFGLGYLFARESNTAPIIIEKNSVGLTDSVDML
ncbi:MAG: hypothetical protein A2745_03515 [Candidatus Harrisonbacteria bacterium RIFCSPHIGHO2_01_FULL_44_13]|uniref:Uncharacterized protein n=1 Tax=Candidatus Harrisonbacteria bacterium RIFCSPLOWO2_01_FULL_44_18 TaxID=1798407 RepID=A0A1G1ZMU9_9BACT|nr:MAG: hypothetical protein A2745_03515 [Candidatus Harrisonbacteria bacterium RIFCSPHIGHO2_01_FULL_44_13]OGY65988.1 MAG: hypothetical protein A3A16_01205 [Candidatus Harrisonbacteria bacterium RIFCSPLOWO2_01_FULL_44_18]